MSDLENDLELDENEDVSKLHSKLLESVAQLEKTKIINKPERTEPSTQVSEFHLVKSGTNREVVRVEDLVKSLGRKGYQREIVKKLWKSKVLSKPLEKPAAERIKRQVGYDNVKKDLVKWKGIIAKNRTAQKLIFPIKRPAKTKDLITKEFLNFRVKSTLMQQLEEEKKEETDPSSQPEEEEMDNKFHVTKEELKLKRKEIAKLKLQQSYREAKARRERKIKSKNFHRIQRKGKIKQQLKEFEELQKTNPQEALAKLEQIEKVRAVERMSLRHKNTGQWAKNKQIRAKYNKEARQVLAEQLSISRELTQKVKGASDDEDDEDEDDDETVPNDNLVSNDNEKHPKDQEIKTASEIDDFVNSYKRYWLEKRKQETKEKEIAEANHGSNPAKEDDAVNSTSQTEEPAETKIESQSKDSKRKNNKDKDSLTPSDVLSKKKKATLKNKKSNASQANKNECHVEELQHNETEKAQCNNKSSKSQDIDEIFDGMEERLKRKMDLKLQKVKKSLKTKKRKEREEEEEEDEDENCSPELEFRNSKRRPVLDEPLEETTSKENAQGDTNATSLRTVENKEHEPVKASGQVGAKEIDPDKYLNIKPKYIKTQLPDMVTGEDENSEQEEEAHRIMSEAFADDDVVEEFRKEKEEEENKKLQEPDANQPLPGWGSWVGPSWKQKMEKKERRKNRRKSKMIILNASKEAPRREENKGKVIIFEHENEKLKKHLVNELPHPFTTVEDYEASIRAPISRTFVSEHAHSRLIQPAVTTKLGQIIEPMDEDVLKVPVNAAQMPRKKPLKKSLKNSPKKPLKRRFDKKFITNGSKKKTANKKQDA